MDDCTRYRVLRLYARRTASNTLDFLVCVMDEMPFPIQRIQTDRGREFFAAKVQEKLMEFGIKFRPNKPGSPHLNGKVERSQKTDKTEFYVTVDLAADNLDELLAAWQHYYNWDRPLVHITANRPWKNTLSYRTIRHFQMKSLPTITQKMSVSKMQITRSIYN